MSEVSTTAPNVLVVICDDLCVGDFSYTGNDYVYTPHLDQFRADGIDSKYHLSGPLCTPARASLLTGMYAQRTRAIDTYCGRSLMDPAITTMADRFKAAGYRTGCFGKWHLGDNCPFRPNERGFEESLIHYSGGVGQPGDAPENAGRESYFDPVLYRNGESEAHKGYVTDIFADAAAEYVAQHKEEPWFTYLAFNAPHTPLQAPPELIERCRERGSDGQLPALYALVEGIDRAFGRLLKKLDETGQRENTIVFFTSDHGPCPSVSVFDGHTRFNMGLRGEKGHVYEGGPRVPAFWQWPAKWSGGRELDTRSHVIDVMPTLIESCGLDAEPQIDGISIADTLLGQSASDEQQTRELYMQWHRGDRPVFYRNSAVWRGKWKWLRVSEVGPDELYDLENDPGEQSNLAAENADLCAELKALYEEWFNEVGASHDYEPLRIHVGDSREPMVRLSRQDWRVDGPDGWSSNHTGHWPIEVIQSGTYDIEIILEESDRTRERGTVSLQLDAQTLSQEAVEGQSRFTFSSVELLSGPHQISGHLWSRFGNVSPLLIEITPNHV